MDKLTMQADYPLSRTETARTSTIGLREKGIS